MGAETAKHEVYGGKRFGVTDGSKIESAANCPFPIRSGIPGESDRNFTHSCNLLISILKNIEVE
ncbi:MAG: hypothetical protein LBE85_08255 [Candidatus Accumulibacter sp.]|jgi:hypothetical protein|nr:hypothetical protein [Accumulibacter sp.]